MHWHELSGFANHDKCTAICTRQFVDPGNNPRYQDHHPICALVSNVLFKNVFLQRGGIRVYLSHEQNAKNVFHFCKGPDPSELVLNFGDSFLSSNRDTDQNVILQGRDLERSISSIMINNTSIGIPLQVYTWSFIEMLLPFLPGRWCNRWPNCDQEEKSRINMETLWCTLTLCDANYAMKEQLEPSNH